MTPSTVLLEIGVEEVPARFLPKAIEDLEKHARAVLEGYFIKIQKQDGITAYATPRRLAVFVEGVPLMQEDKIREIWGPPKKVAFNPDGTLSKAGEKFIGSVGIGTEKLTVKQKNKGEYVAAIVQEKGLMVKDILPDVLKKIILSLNFPKSMKWGSGSFRFVRPIRWLLAVLDSEVIEFELGGIKSSDYTMGHRFLSPAPIGIKDIKEYKSLLEGNFVILDQKKRQGMINKQVEGLTGSRVMDEELLETVAYLVEYPQAVLGSFPDEYLNLPHELIAAVLRGHQKYFSVRDNKGNLTSQFIVVSNTREENADVVRVGAERVIKARLEDARFYFGEDKKTRLDERVKDLKRVVYHEKLGSLYDKTMRIKAISGFLAERLNIDRDKAHRAALLSKTDLITGAVREFPELQGLMGMYYAIEGNEALEVRSALRDQYHPAHLGDYVPQQDVGAILSLSDKADNIASFFSIGLRPTGSEDPFALRRQAISIIKILLEKQYNISIRNLLDTAIQGLPYKADPALDKEILEFFKVRIENYFSIFYKAYMPDTIQSIIDLSAEIPLYDTLKRIDAISGFKEDPEYGDFLLAIKRVRNIIPKKEMPLPEPALFKEEQEKRLFEILKDVKGMAGGLIEKAQYDEALKGFLYLTRPVNNFFDKVLVMDKDESIRQNRLSLLAEIWKAVSAIGDFSKLLSPTSSPQAF